ncbi:hypothetical protein [Pseudomonas sp. BF-R-21]|uniref:hypothetical protein n=1 Tax=Pseudomonas sp. BF-R-21 TaxID=2832387 RepID=UPI001CC0188E|nr:hypothetical protein [Pseudomonas sp. BF-R-21]
MELNPNHPVTQQTHDHWHKFVAIMLYKYGNMTITMADVLAMPDDIAVTVQELEDGIHLCLVSMAEGERLAREQGGRPS